MVSTGPVIRRRLALLMAVFAALFFCVGIQLFRLQILQGEELQRRAQKQWTSESVIAPQRGTIYDRNGKALAMSATAYTASVSPRQVKDLDGFARTLAPILDLSEEYIKERAGDTSKGGVTLKRQISRDIAQQLRVMMAEHQSADSDALDGLYLEEDSKRYYPMGSFASQLLGITSVDGVGQSGLESSLDRYLSGKAGKILDEVDGKGREMAYGTKEYIAAVDGGDVTLTLDSSIQSFAEQAAREAMTVNGAKSVRVLVMEVKTGAILAMCNKPDFDPNDPPRDDVETLNELMRNRIITDSYEPGSTFKIITASAALDAGVTDPNEGFYCSGTIHVDGDRIRCWGNPHGAESMAQGLQNSCNPVFVELGLRLGVDRFYEYLDAFGIGSTTGIDLPGEVAGIRIAQDNVKRVDMARIGFGQSIAMTPLQLMTAACAAVNGGYRMRPYVVQEIRSSSGEVLEKAQPEVMARPISEETSATMRDLLEKVVELGGGRNAYLSNYRVAGKTGTAQVYKDGKVTSDTHIGSFIGFAPADDPQIGVLVIVDEAEKRPDYGSVTAAPFAKQILERSLNYLGIAPRVEDEEPLEQVEVPDVTGMDTAQAEKLLKENGLQGLLSGSGATVIEQMPAAGARVSEQSLVMLYVEGTPDLSENDRVEVPDVTGKSIVEANRLLRSYGLEMEIDGSGLAVGQEPAAGEKVLPTAKVKVSFESPG